MIELRGLEPADAALLYRIAAEPSVAQRLGGTPFDGPEAWHERIAESGSDRSLVLGAFEGGELLGFALFEVMPAVRQRHVGRIAVAVHPDHLRSGVGDRLVGAVIEAAERWFGVVRIELGVHADNAAAIALYQKHGFSVETRRQKDMLVDGVLQEGLGMARIRPGLVVPPALGEPPQLPAPGPRREVRVRARLASDAAAFARLHGTDSVMEGTFQMPYQSAQAWVKRFAGTPSQARVLAAELDGQVVGAAGVFPFGPSPRMRHAAMLGMSVDPRFQGCGVGHALMTAITELADRWLGLSRLVLEVYTDNQRARHLYERHGFVPEGVLAAYALRRGTYVDALQMARVR